MENPCSWCHQVAQSATVSMQATSHQASAQLSCIGCSQKKRPLRSCLTHSVVPHNAKSGQRAYLCQINQPSQLVSCLETICLGLALSTDCRQVWMLWREPNELDLEGCPDPRPPVKRVFSMGEGGAASAYWRQHSITQRLLGNAEGHLRDTFTRWSPQALKYKNKKPQCGWG